MEIEGWRAEWSGAGSAKRLRSQIVISKKQRLELSHGC